MHYACNIHKTEALTAEHLSLTCALLGVEKCGRRTFNITSLGLGHYEYIRKRPAQPFYFALPLVGASQFPSRSFPHFQRKFSANTASPHWPCTIRRLYFHSRPRVMTPHHVIIGFKPSPWSRRQPEALVYITQAVFNCTCYADSSSQFGDIDPEPISEARHVFRLGGRGPRMIRRLVWQAEVIARAIIATLPGDRSVQHCLPQAHAGRSGHLTRSFSKCCDNMTQPAKYWCTMLSQRSMAMVP